MDIRLIVIGTLICCILPVVPSPYRSRSKNSSPTYDQKQTGEYNIQLHLKDFEVVALLSDSAFGDIGDYEYNYDYADLTVKPGILSQTTTKKPTTTKPAILPSTTNLPAATNLFTTESHDSQTTLDTLDMLNIPVVVIKPSETPVLQSTTLKELTIKENEQEVNVSQTALPEKQSLVSELLVKPTVDSAQMSNDNNKINLLNQEESLPIVVHRKCSSGFTRDKLGRCRRVRRPSSQFPFGISRLASLATKLRQMNHTKSSETLTEE